jgi:hypothetical protein
MVPYLFSPGLSVWSVSAPSSAAFDPVGQGELLGAGLAPEDELETLGAEV